MIHTDIRGKLTPYEPKSIKIVRGIKCICVTFSFNHCTVRNIITHEDSLAITKRACVYCFSSKCNWISLHYPVQTYEISSLENCHDEFEITVLENAHWLTYFSVSRLQVTPFTFRQTTLLPDFTTRLFFLLFFFLKHHSICEDKHHRSLIDRFLVAMTPSTVPTQ